MKKLRIGLSILAVVLAAVGSAHAAPVVLNGSFESPDISSGSTSTGGAFWTPSASGVFLFDNASGAGKTIYGNQFIALNPGASDSQTISGFQLGQVYTFSAYFADLFNGANPSLTITLSGIVSLSQTFTAPVGGGYGASNIPFTYASFTLPALTTSGSITLTLTNSGTNGTIAVDNVAVPEPSSVMLALLGLGVLGGAVVAKRRAATVA